MSVAARQSLWVKDRHRPKLDDPLCFTAENASATVTFNKVGSPDAASIMTSTDGQTWTPYTFNTVVTLVNIGDKVYFRAANENDISFYKDSSNYYRFATTAGKRIAASGNIQTLMKADGSRLDISQKTRCYQQMFYDCSSLTSAPVLPATTLAAYCYEFMFKNCTSLTTAPALPATTLADYCYTSMFQGCKSLTATPNLSATALADFCYEFMFADCTSLTTAPELPATTLAPYCYQCMFQNCTSLTTAPTTLPATTLVPSCYEYMFSGCSSLMNAPILPATVLIGNCYGSMFKGCSKIASIDVNFTAWNPSWATSDWVSGVAASGTFTCPSTLPDTRGTSNIPFSWTKVDKTMYSLSQFSMNEG